MVSEPPPVDVLKIVVPPILIVFRLPLVACGQVMDSPVSSWPTAVLFWNETLTVFAEPPLPPYVWPPATTVPGVAVGVAVGVGVGVGVAVGAGPAIVKNTQAWPESPPALFWSPSCTMK